MRVKERAQQRRAQIAEACVLVAAVAWSSWLASEFIDRDSNVEAASATNPHDALVVAVPRVLQALNAVAVAAIARTMLAARAIPKAVEELSRQERDSGLVVGCVLPPLVLLSRFLAIAHEKEPSFSASTLLYTWIAITASASLLVKIVCFGSSGVLPTVAVDAVFVPVVSSLLGVESELRFVLPTIARVAIALVFRFGRLAMRRSFTVGEALIVAQAVGLGVVDLALVTAIKADGESSWLLSVPDRFIAAWHLHTSSHADREAHHLALHVGVVGALLVCVSLTPILRAYGSPSPHAAAPPLPLGASAQFLGIVGSVFGAVVYPWACFLLDTWNPLAWLIDFLLDDAARWQLIGYWLACLVVCVPAFTVVSRVFVLRQIVARKLFHLLVVLMFVPAFFLSHEMLSLSYGVAFAAFCLVECVRAVSLPPFGKAIAQFVSPFIDHREGGRVILTHTYLLLGCALPLWLAHAASTDALAANAGVLALGVGDALGAVVGSTIGKRRLFGRKTVEGTAAVLLSIAVASLAFHEYHARASTDGEYTQLALLLVGVALTSVLEAATAQIDNLVLSLFLFAVANLVACHA